MRRSSIVAAACGLALLVAGGVAWRMLPQPVEAATSSGGGIAVVTATAATKDLPLVRHAVGWMEAVATVDVKSRISGIVTGQHVADGQTVAAGDVLFELDDRALQAVVAKDAAQIDRDQAALDIAHLDARRTADLAARHAGSQQDAETAAATEKSAAATLEADRAQADADGIALGYATIAAPIAGRAGAVTTNVGALVSANDTTGLVTLTQMAPLDVRFALPDSDLDMLRSAFAQGRVPVAVSVAGAAVPAEGRLVFIDSAVDTTTGTIAAKAEVANADGALWPGQYVDVALTLAMHMGATAVPLVAVQEGQDGPFVWLVDGAGKAKRQAVATGIADGADVEITHGLAAGDQVVVEGQLRLRDGVPVAASAEGASS
jgi:multidrug efflux system membrane fusion protein